MMTLILTDNLFALGVARELQHQFGEIDVFQSPHGKLPDLPRIDVRTNTEQIVARYGFVLSVHCKQLFPREMVSRIRCVNVHPGINPQGRGWFPQVFAIANGTKAGVTIHEIDEELDHGPIISQRECPIESWDTSGSLYAKLLKIEREMVLDQFPVLRAGTYRAVSPNDHGQVFYKKDFERLKLIDLNETGRFSTFLNRLRALTHDEYRNAYFLDSDGTKVFVRVVLDRAADASN